MLLCVLNVSRLYFGQYSFPLLWGFYLHSCDTWTLNHHPFTTRRLLLQGLSSTAQHSQLPAGSGSDKPSDAPTFYNGLWEKITSPAAASYLLQVLPRVSLIPGGHHVATGWYGNLLKKRYCKVIRLWKNKVQRITALLSARWCEVCSRSDVRWVTIAGLQLTFHKWKMEYTALCKMWQFSTTSSSRATNIQCQ